MRKKNILIPIIPIILVLFLFSLILEAKASEKAKDLPERFKKWLEEEIAYVITPKEKEVFLQLEKDKERDLFIEAFWKHRDSIPDTPENEFKVEHYRRINYTNNWFGRGTPTVGWRTDMGRIYIILGEPKSIEKYENETEIYPTIVWFYQGMTKYGLPDAFNVVFFKKYAAGDYEIYSPIKDGPQSLLIHYQGDPRDYLAAFNKLKSIRPPLAYTSLTLIPGESWQAVAPNMASEILISNIYVKPQKAVKDDYAEKLLKYKDIIEVEYSASYIGNDSLISIYKDKSGISFVHYLIEPEKLSVGLAENKYYTTLELSGLISDLKGKTIYQFNKLIPIQFDKEQLKKIQTKPFSLQDIFPIVEGYYNFNLLLKNRVSKEFTSIEKDLIIPSFDSEEMTSLILAYQVKHIPTVTKTKPFKVGDIQLYSSSRNEFSIHDKLYIFFQIPGISEEVQQNGLLQFVFYKKDQEFLRKIKEIKTYPQNEQFLEQFSLKNFPPAYYRIEVNVLANEERKIISELAYFSVSQAEVIPRPFIFSEQHPSSFDPLVDYTVGGQYFNSGNLQKAKEYLEKAYRKKPDSLKFAEGISRVYFTEKKFGEAKKVLLPFIENPQKDYNFLRLLGQASQYLDQFEEAIDHYKKYLSHYGTHLEVLNSIGYCYLELGNRTEALKAWEKSLEVNPNQERIKRIVSSLKEKS